MLNKNTLMPLRVIAVDLHPGGEWSPQLGGWRFLWVERGTCYWLGLGGGVEATEGDLLLAGPLVRGTIRSSQIGSLSLRTFHFVPDLLMGVLSMNERRFFEAEAINERNARVQRVSSNQPLAQRSGKVLRGLGAGGLSERLQVLALAVEAFADPLRGIAPPRRSLSARERLLQMMSAMPDSEFPDHAPGVLARLCGCSPRHFNRLFIAEYGVSVRSRQSTLRLAKAKALLAESDDKVVDVAQGCGYRNLSLFNMLFKRAFRMTPSEWRRKAARQAGLATRALAVMTLVVLAVRVLLLGSAGMAAATNPPPAAATPSPRFAVDRYELQGNTLLDPTVTGAILKRHSGPSVSLEEVRSGLAELQSAYRARGYATVAVSLPQQRITNGVVRVLVTEGRLGEIRIRGNRHYSDENVLREFPGLRTNILLNSLVFQQQLDRANASRDRQVYPVIGPGVEPGTTDLELRVKDRLPLHARLEVNNSATPHTPDLRLDLAVQYNNLWQRNHQVGVQYGFSPELYKSGPFPFYELPRIANYSAFYRLPLFGMSGVEPSQDLSADRFGYDEATRRFRPPAASRVAELIVYGSRSSVDTGRRLQSQSLSPSVVPPEGALQISDQVYAQTFNPNENLGFRLVLPLPALGTLQSSASVGMDFKSYRTEVVQDRLFQATLYVPEVGSAGPPFMEFPSPPTETSRTVHSGVQYLPLSLGWNGSVRDRLGGTWFDLGTALAPANVLSSATEFREVVSDRDADGRFVVLTAGITREQEIGKGWALRLHADGQWSSQPLLSTEQASLGGWAGVRGYREGQLYGDRAWRVQFEPHSPYVQVSSIDASTPILARLYGFFDAGQRFQIGSGLGAPPPAPSPDAAALLMGTGFGINCQAGEHFDLRLQLGFALRTTPAEPPFGRPDRRAGNPLASFSLTYKF